jgi:hypothetical protein
LLLQTIFNKKKNWQQDEKMNFFGLIATLLFGVLALNTARAWPVGAPEMVIKINKFRI